MECDKLLIYVEVLLTGCVTIGVYSYMISKRQILMIVPTLSEKRANVFHSDSGLRCSRDKCQHETDSALLSMLKVNRMSIGRDASDRYSCVISCFDIHTYGPTPPTGENRQRPLIDFHINPSSAEATFIQRTRIRRFLKTSSSIPCHFGIHGIALSGKL